MPAGKKKNISDLKLSLSFVTSRSTIWLLVNSLYSFYSLLFLYFPL